MTEEKKKRVRTDKLRNREREYKDRTLRQFTFKLRRNEDADLIEAYEGIENKREFMREVLRRYIEESKTEEQ